MSCSLYLTKSMSLLEHHPSCNLLLYFYECMMETLTNNISRLNFILLICILLCLTILNTLIAVLNIISAFIYLSQAILSFVHPQSLEVKPVLGSKAEDELTLSEKEIEMVMKKLGIECIPYGTKLRGKLGVDDFAAVFEEEEPSLEEVKEAFNMFDVNKNGYIDEMDLKRVLCALGFKGTSEVECRRMIQAFDNDGDGKINFKEFGGLMENSFCL